MTYFIKLLQCCPYSVLAPVELGRLLGLTSLDVLTRCYEFQGDSSCEDQKEYKGYFYMLINDLNACILYDKCISE